MKIANHLIITIMKTLIIRSLESIARIALLTVLVWVSACEIKKDSTTGSDSSAVSKPEVEAPSIDIHTAVVTENMEALKQHIAAGTNINEKDPFGGSSPLISAAVFGKPQMAKV